MGDAVGEIPYLGIRAGPQPRMQGTFPRLSQAGEHL